MPKLKCYDKYRKQHLIIDLDNDGHNDSINGTALSSPYCMAMVNVHFLIDDEYHNSHPKEHAEDPIPERWSDLTDFELVNE